MQAIFNSFVRLTKEELWDSEEELRAYVCANGNYEKLLNGEIGINLIQTHTAMSLAVMDDWVKYVFETVDGMLGDDSEREDEWPEVFADVKSFCVGRTHNLWGSDRNEDNPTALLHYDVPHWMRSPLSMSLAQFN